MIFEPAHSGLNQLILALS